MAAGSGSKAKPPEASEEASSSEMLFWMGTTIAQVEAAVFNEDLTFSQWIILYCVQTLEKSGPALIANKLGISRQAANQGCKKLAEAGLVEMSAGEKGKSKALALTARGTEKLTAAEEKFSSVFGEVRKSKPSKKTGAAVGALRSVSKVLSQASKNQASKKANEKADTTP